MLKIRIGTKQGPAVLRYIYKNKNDIYKMSKTTLVLLGDILIVCLHMSQDANLTTVKQVLISLFMIQTN